MTKKLFLCIQRSAPSSESQPSPSPSQMEQMYAAFNQWREKFEENIVDMGGKLGAGAVVTADGKTDGPFIEVKEIAGGFMIVEANSLAEALTVAQESPGTMMPGSSVEVREIHKG